MADLKLSPLQIFWIYLRLGCISFGGPVAHLGYFKDEFVNRRRWLSDARYTELLGLCQFVPGPSSSQLGFAIGWHKGGLPGACMAWLGFTLPSALLMVSFAYGLFAYGESTSTFIDGLLIAAVAVVANAVIGLGKNLCPDLKRLGIALLSTALMLLVSGTMIQIGAILIGAALGNLFYRKACGTAADPGDAPDISRGIVYGALITYAVCLLTAVIINSSNHYSVYAVHYQAGALVFGGGHVVLPLLQAGLVPNMMAEGTFLAGYSAAQALPGPLFTLSAFTGTASGATSPLWLGGLGSLIAIFLPGMLLLLGLIPFWNKLRHRKWAQAALMGANAAVVGLLLAALINPVWPHGIRSWTDFAIAGLAFFALYRFKAPAWLVVLGCGLAGFVVA
jgi:chromate transporter